MLPVLKVKKRKDIYDVSDFIPDNKAKIINRNVEKTKKNDINDLLDLYHICDISLLVFSTAKKKENIKCSKNKVSNSKVSLLCLFRSTKSNT